MWKTYQKILNETIENHPDISNVCDLGCGMGNFIFEILSKDYFDEVIGVDFLNETLHIANEEQSLFQRAYFIQADLLTLPFKTESIDVVFCLNVLHHFQKNIFEIVLAEIARVTKNIMVIEIRNRRYLGDFLYKRIIISYKYHKLPIYSYYRSYVTNILEKEGFHLISCKGKRNNELMSRRLVFVYQKKTKKGDSI
jgi:ubiquinone/menaquinone biosynthesis C-methylase UbiE